MSGNRPPHPNRSLVRIGEDHWAVHCKRCGKSTKQYRTTAAACNEWFIEHSATDFHRNFDKRKFDADVAELVARVTETP